MKNSCLIVVDCQLDFMPGGALPVPDGDKIIPVINQLLPKFDLVIFTQDWHPADSNGFASQHEGKKPFDKFINKDYIDTLWPDHCIAGTPGADFHKDLDYSKCIKNFYIFRKGLDKNSQGYSAFEDTKLAEFLKKRKIDEVYVSGLAGDYCCKATAIDADKAGFNTSFIIDAVKFIDPDYSRTFYDVLDYDIHIIESRLILN